MLRRGWKCVAEGVGRVGGQGRGKGGGKLLTRVLG